MQSRLPKINNDRDTQSEMRKTHNQNAKMFNFGGDKSTNKDNNSTAICNKSDRNIDSSNITHKIKAVRIEENPPINTDRIHNNNRLPDIGNLNKFVRKNGKKTRAHINSMY